MKNLKLIYAFAVAMFMFCSCNNDYPVFDDADAFVAFQSTTVSVGENEGKIEIPVTLASLAGIETDVEYELIDTLGAKEGKQFSISGDKKLHFTKDAPTQKIVVNVTDDDVFNGNVKFIIKLKEGSVKTGDSNTCTVTIEDDEHPLKFILHSYSGTVSDAWDETQTFNWTITRDESDNSKVWIEGFSGRYPDLFNHVYGVVNDDHTQISIPAGQSLYKTSSYDVKLWVAAPDDPTADGEIYDSGMDLVVTIQDGGKTLAVTQAWYAYDPDNGAFEGYNAGTVLTQK